MWPFRFAVLVLDDDDLFRDSIAFQLDEAGCPNFVAERTEEAITILKRHPEIGVALVDQSGDALEVRAVVENIHSVRPEVIVIGSSGPDRREEYLNAGVARFLPKPWLVDGLVDQILERIERCASCGMSLPLRRPGPGEDGESWVCASCGCRYRAVLFENVPEGHLRNARKPV